MTDTLQTTPLHDLHTELGARLVPFAGYSMPIQYAGIVKEHTAVRTGAGIFDVSHMGELFLAGDEAVSVADSLVTGAVAKLELGQALYTVACNEKGTILDDLIVYRLAEKEVMIICNASNRAKIADHVGSHADGRCDFADRSDAFALIALQGPKAESILEAAGGGELSKLGFFRTGEGDVAGVSCRVARTGYTGEDGFEIVVPNENAVAIWNAFAAEGATPTGLGARDTLRLEARLSLYGNEIDETTHPYEAGLGWVVKLKHGDFVGRDALTRIKKEGWERKLVGFEMTGREIARSGYPIVQEGSVIGKVTSGSPSPTLSKNIGLGYVPKALAKVGSTFGVDIRGKRVGDAIVVKPPFYKRS
ncbi:MAG: glycine cleavage system aminomethyltransferase GcvT [Polyangiales bacterium]